MLHLDLSSSLYLSVSKSVHTQKYRLMYNVNKHIRKKWIRKKNKEAKTEMRIFSVKVALIMDRMFDLNQIDPDLLKAHWEGQLDMDLCFLDGMMLVYWPQGL